MGYKFLFDVQRYVSAIAHTELRPPNCWVSDDALTYTIGRSSLTMATVRRGIQDAYEELETLLKDLTGNRRVDVRLEDIVDDLSNTTRGYSFASEEPFASNMHSLFLQVVKEQKLCLLDAKGNVIWNRPATRRWLNKTGKYWRIVSWLLAITAQVSTRLTQDMETTFVNGDHLRSIIIQAGEMILMLRYHKSSHGNGDKAIPAFVARRLAELIVQPILMGLRYTEGIFIHYEVGREEAELHRTYVNGLSPRSISVH